jgi:hypothetical protein
MEQGTKTRIGEGEKNAMRRSETEDTKTRIGEPGKSRGEGAVSAGIGERV